MKKFMLLLLAAGSVIVSCNKTKHVPVSYSVETENGEKPQDVYVPDSGSKYVELYVKFLTGSTTDSVTLEVQNLPAGITVNPQRSSGVPTYYYKYTYKSNNIAVGTYPVSIKATAPGTDTKTFNYNLVVIPRDCGTLFLGTLSGSNTCSAREYSYSMTTESTDTKNQLLMHNFGGYGLNTNVFLTINCEQDSVYIYSQNIGNGITLNGTGTFTSGKMTISYNATGSTNESCTAILTK